MEKKTVSPTAHIPRPYANTGTVAPEVKQLKKNLALFLTGGTIYPALEILCRGKTDFSMALAGGACLCLINSICNGRLRAMPLSVRCFAGSSIITAVEFGTGVVVNLILKMNVWDYSQMPMNILGQICMPFSILWYVTTLPAMLLCRGLDRLTAARE